MQRRHLRRRGTGWAHRPLAGPHLATDVVAILHNSPTTTRAALRVHSGGPR